MTEIGVHGELVDTASDLSNALPDDGRFVEDVVHPARWVALWCVALCQVLFVPVYSYPTVIPGGYVVSSSSILAHVFLAILLVVSALLGAFLSTRVAKPLAVFAGASLPLLLPLGTLLWGVPAAAAVVVLAVLAGAAYWAVAFRSHGGSPLAVVCVSAIACVVGLVALLSFGKGLLQWYPYIFSTGYASVDESEARGVDGELAASLLELAVTSDGGHPCEAVAVAPFCTDFEGRFMSWARDGRGRYVLAVASEYVGSYTREEISERASHMLTVDDNTAALYTRWLDMRLWIAMHPEG